MRGPVQIIYRLTGRTKRPWSPRVNSDTIAPMTDSPIKTRFAPSPTGRVHLGNARTALFSYLLAHRDAGRFVLRIEDTDTERSQPELEQALADDLAWLGLEWDEGPDQPGPGGPYRQSERTQVYAAYYQRLIDAGQAYPCFCSSQELQMVRKAQLAAGQPPRYPGTCARLTAEEVAERYARGLVPTLRFRVPAGQWVYEDLVRGTQRFRNDEIGDFIIQKADGSAAFFFSNAVDDALMGITHVLRGEDHLTNTPRQLMLLDALGLPQPRYGHIALIVGPDGQPLSKRAGAASIAELRAAGYRPEAVVNHLARLGHYYAEEGLMDRDALAAAFQIPRLGKAAARHDPVQLDRWQRTAVHAAADADLWAWIQPDIASYGLDREQGLELVRAIRDNVTFPEDARHWVQVLLADEPPPGSHAAREPIQEAGPAFFETVADQVLTHGLDYDALIKAVKAETGRSGRRLFMPLRAAWTGETRGPELPAALRVMGAARAEQRLRRVAAWLRDTA